MRNTNGEVYVPSRLLKKAKSPLRHRVTESQRREGFRTYQKCQQILTLFVLIFLCVSVSLWLRLVFHQPAGGKLSSNQAALNSASKGFSFVKRLTPRLLNPITLPRQPPHSIHPPTRASFIYPH